MDYQDMIAVGPDEATPENEISVKVAQLVTKIIVNGSLPGQLGRDPDAAIDGVLMGLALVMEQAPEAATSRDLRQQCEDFGKRLHYHAKLFRGAYEQGGVHPIAHIIEGFGQPP